MTKEQYDQILASMKKRVADEPGNAEAWRDLAQLKMAKSMFDARKRNG